MLVSFLSGAFLLHIPCFLFDVGSFSGMQPSLNFKRKEPKEKSWVEDGPEKKCEKVTLKTEKEPYNTLYRGEFLLHVLC